MLCLHVYLSFIDIIVDVFSWLNGVWKLLGKSVMIGELIAIVWILLHSRCSLKCVGEWRNSFELEMCILDKFRLCLWTLLSKVHSFVIEVWQGLILYWYAMLDICILFLHAKMYVLSFEMTAYFSERNGNSVLLD